MDSSLITFLLAVAIRMTGLPAVPESELPPFVPLSPEELERQICPDAGNGCKGIAAYFDVLHYRILYRDTLDLDEPLDHSYLLHEIVHVLQHRQVGNAMYADCWAMLQSEGQAYRAQNSYLRMSGQLAYVGGRLRDASCVH